MIRLGKFFFKFRDGVFPAVFLALALGSMPLYPSGNETYDLCLDAVGIVIAALGQALRAVVIGLAYIKRGGKNKQVYADNLVQDGLFAHSRNPLYVGNLLILLGLIIIHNSLSMYLIGVPFYLIAYLAIVAAEEDYLRSKFGAEYEAYCKRVNRFLPSLKGLSKTVDGMTFDWRRVIRKEYGSTFVWMACVLGLMMWERVRHFGYPERSHQIIALLAGVIPLVLLYATARILKKKRLLGHD